MRGGAERKLADKGRAFRCGHPKTPDNTYPVGAKYSRCKECHLARVQEHRARITMGLARPVAAAPKQKQAHPERFAAWRTIGRGLVGWGGQR